MFHDYLAQYRTSEIPDRLVTLFKILDTKEEDRRDSLDEQLAKFPYVNGGLFAVEDDNIPKFTEEIRKILLEDASEHFDWSNISPTVFGAVFESTLNPETRTSGGMHYTSIENIHKVIDPLFLDDLKNEFASIRSIQTLRTKKKRLLEFQDKLASLTFLDPAAGSGNFLTETYLSLRRLENEIFRMMTSQIGLSDENTSIIKVSISQFYGIEINDFAVAVAKTALWIAENQMIEETKDITQIGIDFLPLKTNPNIWEKNALRADWNEVVSKDKLNYIISNPPFVGARRMKQAQKDDILNTFGTAWKNTANLDYVGCWYKKAADYMLGTQIHAALVSTNSITQGEQVPILWKNLLKQGICINFAHRTFQWDNEAKNKAHVHCVIIGFSYDKTDSCKIFTVDSCEIFPSINPYLVFAPNIVIESRKNPICKVPNIVFGSMPNDNKGRLSDYTEEAKNAIVAEYPIAEKMFRPFLGATEFLHGAKRYCLWLKDIPPHEIQQVKPILDAIDEVRDHRKNSKREETKSLADDPTLFGEIRQPNSDYILIPCHSSEKRKYIPIGFVSCNYICGNANLMMPNATLFHFGVLTSIVHNAWMRTVAGRLEMRYRYSAGVVYNNFPWPSITPEQKAKIEKTAQAILDARALYPESSLADMYGEDMYLYSDLDKAHKTNDRAVMEAYGLPYDMDESSIVAELMKRYVALTSR